MTEGQYASMIAKLEAGGMLASPYNFEYDSGILGIHPTKGYRVVTIRVNETTKIGDGVVHYVGAPKYTGDSLLYDDWHFIAHSEVPRFLKGIAASDELKKPRGWLICDKPDNDGNPCGYPKSVPATNGQPTCTRHSTAQDRAEPQEPAGDIVSAIEKLEF